MYFTRPSLFTHSAKRADLLQISGELFDVVQREWVRVGSHLRYALRDAANAHRDWEGWRTTGSSILLP
ncbi:hypothetical protein [Mycetohabitans sp. B46]|uniref:hypothetical protein n=1 Tax=Mycetohabitans sp. B46 TaxID=2772536 RepID=UPI00307E4C29